MVSASRGLRSEGVRGLRSMLVKSYQEISSDDEDLTVSNQSSSDEIPLATRRPSSQRSRTSNANASSRRTRSRSAARSSGGLLQSPPEPTSTRRGAVRKRRLALSNDSDSGEILYEAPRKRVHTSKRTRTQTIGALNRSKSRKTSPPKKVEKPYDIALAGGKIPDWTSLPYDILRQIFEYAGAPSYDPRTFHATPSSEWLLKSSRTCKAFAEPALTALYKCPALAPMIRAHSLADLLDAREQQLMSYNYRYKIEAIHIEVHQTASYVLQHHGVLDLCKLLVNLPRLSSLELYHKKDFSPYRELDHSVKWSYPEAMFFALGKNVEGVPTRLRSWRWNSRLAKNIPIEKLIEYHQRPCFARLEKIAICNYHIAKPSKGETATFVDPDHEGKLAEALVALPNLRHLILESSTLVNSTLMPLLPAVESLEIINCWDITSEDLLSYLTFHGSKLRHLKLDHNLSLNLSFLTQLGTLCPKLVTLKMDMTYFSVHTSYDNSDPVYECLLEVDEVPEWPATLQTIELHQLRHWAKKDRAVETAQRFFQSLLDSAETLKDLRRLVIKGTLNIAWRDRASFRERWYEPFHNVFQRQSYPPNHHLRTISVFQTYQKSLKSAQQAQEAKKARLLKNEEEDEVTCSNPRRQAASQSCEEQDLKEINAQRSLRRRSKAQYREDSSSASELDLEDVDLSYIEISEKVDGFMSPSQAQPSASKKHKGLTRASRELEILHACAGIDSPQASQNPASDPEDQGRNVSGEKGKDVMRKQYVQGMCNIVDIKIDNLRPAENQFKESDFLDSEPEDDSDYDGTGDVEGF